ncbi:hypothetical protein Patl1_21368 [Pistacia atlantica]|uniref:Uncharacterized protein n=1 Tax=Pistacia atlantica TaxID=434234 RepID=A0ACC1BJR1_9ROSI|nr:hypothetical protein Patl1_21368 [Pistacia atlantica]
MRPNLILLPPEILISVHITSIYSNMCRLMIKRSNEFYIFLLHYLTLTYDIGQIFCKIIEPYSKLVSNIVIHACSVSFDA